MSTKNIQCKKRKIVVWIISIGIIAAVDLAYADQITLSAALSGRTIL